MYAAIFLGPVSRGPRDDRALIDYCITQATRAANVGFSTITFGEQHFNNYEPYCNPLLMGARLSGVLKDSYFATTVMPLPFHNPIRLAEDINVLDQLLGGKLIVGMSAGRPGAATEFANFGLDHHDQRTIFAEKFAALETLWAHKLEDGPIVFDGPSVKGGVHGRLMPVSYRAPRPLVAVGSNTEATVRKAGLDGNVVFLGPASVADAGRKFRCYAEGLDEGGYDDAYKADRLQKSMVHHQTVVAETDDEAWSIVETRMAFNPMMNRTNDPRTLRQMYNDGVAKKSGLTEQEAKNSEAAQGWYMAGSPETIVEQFRAHEAVGIQQVHTRFNAGSWNPEGWDRAFNLFVDEVMPKINAQTFPAPAGAEVQEAVRQGPMPTSTGAPRPGGQGPQTSVLMGSPVAA